MKKRTKRIVAMVVCMAIMTSVAVYYDWEKTGNVADENTANVASVATRVADAIKGMVGGKSKDNDNNEDTTDAVEDAVESPVADTMAEKKIVTNVKGVSFENEDTSKFEADKIYTMTYTTPQDMLADTNVVPSVEMTATGKQLETLAIGGVIDNPLLCDKIPGYIGHAYNFTMEGEFDKAKLIFNVDDTVDMSKEPTIYYYNEDTQCLEELETTVSGTTISAYTTHFSKYILVYKSDWQKSKERQLELQTQRQFPTDVTFFIDGDIGLDSTYKKIVKKHEGGGYFFTENLRYTYLSVQEALEKKENPWFENKLIYGGTWFGYLDCYNKINVNADYLDSLENFLNYFYYSSENGIEVKGLLNLQLRFIDKVWCLDEDHHGCATRAELYNEDLMKGYNQSLRKKGDIEGVKNFINITKMHLEKGYDCRRDVYVYPAKLVGAHSDPQINNETIVTEIMESPRFKKNEVGNKCFVYLVGDVIDKDEDLKKIFELAKANDYSLYFIGVGEKIKSRYNLAFNNKINNLVKKYQEKDVRTEYFYAEDVKSLNEIMSKQLPKRMEEDFRNKDTDKDGLYDYDEFRLNEGLLTTGTGIKAQDLFEINDVLDLTDAQYEEYKKVENTEKRVTVDYINPFSKDTDNDGLDDGKEIKIKENRGKKEIKEETKNDVVEFVPYFQMLSDPTKFDSDGDGFSDKEEVGDDLKEGLGTNPMRYDITDLTLGYAAWFAYQNLYDWRGKTIREIEKNNIVKLADDGEYIPYEYLKSFTVAYYCSQNESGLGLTIIKRNIDGKENFIVCCRGQEDDKADKYTLMTIAFDLSDKNVESGAGYNYRQLEEALKVCNNMADSSSNWYVTGHSMGGRIAQDLYTQMPGNFKAGATFNGLGYFDKSESDNFARFCKNELNARQNFIAEWLIGTYACDGVYRVSSGIKDIVDVISWLCPSKAELKVVARIGKIKAIKFKKLMKYTKKIEKINDYFDKLTDSVNILHDASVKTVKELSKDTEFVLVVYEILRECVSNEEWYSTEKLTEEYHFIADVVQDCYWLYVVEFLYDRLKPLIIFSIATTAGKIYSDLVGGKKAIKGLFKILGMEWVYECIEDILGKDGLEQGIRNIIVKEIEEGIDTTEIVQEYIKKRVDLRKKQFIDEATEHVYDWYFCKEATNRVGTAWKNIPDEYKNNQTKFNNYYYAQDFLGGELVDSRYFSRIGRQEIIYGRKMALPVKFIELPFSRYMNENQSRPIYEQHIEERFEKSDTKHLSIANLCQDEQLEEKVKEKIKKEKNYAILNNY